MIRINLLPEELRRKESMRIKMPEIPIRRAVSGFLVFFIGIQLLVGAWAAWQHASLTRLAALTKEWNDRNRDLSLKKAKTKEAREQIKTAQGLSVGKFHWSRLLNAVSDSVTKGIWLQSLSVTESGPSAKKDAKKAKTRHLQLEGSVMARGEETAYTGKFIQSLKANPTLAGLFSDVRLSTIQQRKIKDIDVYDFVLICDFKADK